jgi:chromosome segregation ATPase
LEGRLKRVALILSRPSGTLFFFRLVYIKVVPKSLAFPVNVIVNDLPLERIAGQAHNHRANVMSEELTQQLPNDLLRQILARLNSMDARFGRMEQRLDRVEMRLDSMEQHLDRVETRLDSMDARLTTLEEKVDRRLQETRPIWEGVLEQLKEINARLDRVEKDINDLRRMFRSGFIDLARVQDNLEERVDKIEARLAPQQETPTT